MSLFECEKCHCVDNTAVAHYWGQDEKLCSLCGMGRWHGHFKRRPAKGMLISDWDNFLYSKEQAKSLPKHIKIVGIVTNDMVEVPRET